MGLIRSLIKGTVEPFAARVIGRIFWPPVSVAVLAHGDNKDILALHNGENYELPGGLVEPREQIWETAKRELKEETGFDCEVGDLLDIRIGDRYGNIEFFFEAQVTGGEKSGSWEGEPEFISKDEIEDTVWKLEHSHIHEYLFPEEK